MNNSLEPIACSLPARESNDQVGEWRELAAKTLIRRPIDGGYVVTFAADQADVVEDLARRESACCGFLTIETKRSDEGISLVITSNNPEALPLIDLLIG